MNKTLFSCLLLSVALLAPVNVSAEQICEIVRLDDQVVNRCISRAQWDREVAAERQRQREAERRRLQRQAQSIREYQQRIAEKREEVIQAEQIRFQQHVDFEQALQGHTEYEQLAESLAQFCIQVQRYPLNGELTSWERLQGIAQELTVGYPESFNSTSFLNTICITAVEDIFPVGTNLHYRLTLGAIQATEERQEIAAWGLHAQQRINEERLEQEQERLEQERLANLDNLLWERIRSFYACRNVQRRLGQTASAAFLQSGNRRCLRLVRGERQGRFNH